MEVFIAHKTVKFESNINKTLVGINGSIYTFLNNICLYLQIMILSFMN